MNDRRVVSRRFPYVPIRLELHDHVLEILAFLDTGFDGDVLIPNSALPTHLAPDGSSQWQLADGSVVDAPAYAGAVWIGGTRLTSTGIVALGNEPLVGRGVTDHFTVILDHGRQLIIEP